MCRCLSEALQLPFIVPLTNFESLATFLSTRKHRTPTFQFHDISDIALNVSTLSGKTTGR